MINEDSKMGKSTDLPVRQAAQGSKTSNVGIDKFTVKTGLARMLKGGVIMDVINAEQVSPQTTLCRLQNSPLSLGPHRRRSRRLRCNGPRACPRRHPCLGRRSPHVRPLHDKVHPRDRHNPCHGKSSHRAFRRMPNPRIYIRRLHRRIRSPDTSRQRPSR